METNQSHFKLVRTTRGALSILDQRVGEIMHNPLGPWREVQDLYIQPASLEERLKSTSSGHDLTLFDVGLGAGANAMGALSCAFKVLQEQGPRGAFKIHSFEKDLTLARFALEQRESFPEFSWGWDALQSLLENGDWSHPEVSLDWQLHHGDFAEALAKPLPCADLIFYDPYSPNRNKEMWTYQVFQKLRQKCHSDSDQETLLLTYSRSTSIRAALLSHIHTPTLTHHT